MAASGPAYLVEQEALTTGCFYFPAQPAGPGAPAPPPLPTDAQAHQRAQAFEAEWLRARLHIQALLETANATVFDSIAAFCRSESHQHLERATSLISPFQEVPTAVLLTGINVPDHEAVFASLAENLQANLTPHCVTLRSYECRATATIMKQLVQRLLGLHGQSHHNPTAVQLSRLPTYDFQVVRSWYDHWYGSRAWEDRPAIVILLQDFEAFENQVLADFIVSLSQHCSALPLALVLGVASTPDVVQRHLPRAAITRLATQRFRLRHSPRILTDFTTKVLMDPTARVVLGWRPLQELLDNFFFHDLSINNISMGLKACFHQYFATRPWPQLASQPPCADLPKKKPAKKGPAPPPTPLDPVDSSAPLSTTLPNYQCCCLAAFMAHHLAESIPAEAEPSVSRQLTSWMVLCLQRPLAEVASWSRLKVYLGTLSLEALRSTMENALPLLKRRQDVLAGLVAMSAAHHACTAAIEALELLLHPPNGTATAVREPVPPGHSAWPCPSPASLSLGTGGEKDARADGNVQAGDGGEESPAPEVERLEPAAESRATVEELLAGAVKPSKKLQPSAAARRREALRSFQQGQTNPIQEERKRLLQGLLALVERLCIPPADNVGSMSGLFNDSTADLLQVSDSGRGGGAGNARRRLHDVLSLPSELLSARSQLTARPQSKDSNPKRRRGQPLPPMATDSPQLTPDTSDLSALPDLSIAYHLYLECGRLINMHDWLKAFVSVVCDGSAPPPAAKKSKPAPAPTQEPFGEEDEEALRPEDVPLAVQARFARAVTELQFLGLVKPTKRKVDHVQRLTWGHI